MTETELIEAARISFVLPEAMYESIHDVMEAAKKKYGVTSKEYRDGLEGLILCYIYPYVRRTTKHSN